MKPRRWFFPPHGVRQLVVTGAVLVGLCTLTGRVYAQASDPLAVVNAFNAAVNAGDVDAALALFAPDAVAEFPNQPPPNLHRGTQEIRTWLEADVAQHIQVTTKNVQAAGERVTWDGSVVVDDLRPLGIALEGVAEALVKEGKITSFAFTLSDDTLAKLQAATAPPPALPQTGGAPAFSWWLLIITGLVACGLSIVLRRRVRW